MRIGRRVRGVLRGEVPLGAFDSLSASAAECYQLVEDAPAGSWERVAGWNAFVCQIYADNLLHSEGSCTIPPDTATVASELYALAHGWLERAALLRDDPARRLEVDLHAALPHFRTPLRSAAQIAAMRATADDLRVRVAYDLQRFNGSAQQGSQLHQRLGELDALLERVELLWLGRQADAMRGAIGDSLSDGIARASELGQLLVRPELLAASAS